METNNTFNENENINMMSTENTVLGSMTAAREEYAANPENAEGNGKKRAAILFGAVAGVAGAAGAAVLANHIWNEEPTDEPTNEPATDEPTTDEPAVTHREVVVEERVVHIQPRPIEEPAPNPNEIPPVTPVTPPDGRDTVEPVEPQNQDYLTAHNMHVEAMGYMDLLDDGTEYLIAVVSTPEGDKYVLIDADHDEVFDIVTLPDEDLTIVDWLDNDDPNTYVDRDMVAQHIEEQQGITIDDTDVAVVDDNIDDVVIADEDSDNDDSDDFDDADVTDIDNDPMSDIAQVDEVSEDTYDPTVNDDMMAMDSDPGIADDIVDLGDDTLA